MMIGFLDWIKLQEDGGTSTACVAVVPTRLFANPLQTRMYPNVEIIGKKKKKRKFSEWLNELYPTTSAGPTTKNPTSDPNMVNNGLVVPSNSPLSPKQNTPTNQPASPFAKQNPATQPNSAAARPIAPITIVKGSGTEPTVTSTNATNAVAAASSGNPQSANISKGIAGIKTSLDKIQKPIVKSPTTNDITTQTQAAQTASMLANVQTSIDNINNKITK